jgi:hypothetical protein
MVSVSRGRLPSFDVQQETRAALAAAIESKRLPRTFADIGGIIVTEKNSFIHITEASEEFAGCDQDLIPSGSSTNPSPRDRSPDVADQPEGTLRERAVSFSTGTARTRRGSCPPKLEVANALLQSTNTSTLATRSRRHYSIDFNHHTVTPSNRSSPSSPLKPVDETSASTLPDTPVEVKTTVMLRNVPYAEGQLGVLALVEERGFAGRFDFFYAPLDFSSSNNLGYAFVNLLDAEAVSEFFAVFDGLRIDRDGWGQKDLQVCWARVQGYSPNVEHYRNSPVNDMPENFRPMIFDSNGRQIPFPRPDENVVRRPVPTTSIYSGGNRATNRPRFASAHLPSNSGNGGSSTVAARRRLATGSFHRS